MVFLCMPLASALNLGSDQRPEGVGINFDQLKVNYSTLYVNNSQYWDGHAWSDTRWLNIDGSNANQDININNYTLTTGNSIIEGRAVVGDSTLLSTAFGNVQLAVINHTYPASMYSYTQSDDLYSNVGAFQGDGVYNFEVASVLYSFGSNADIESILGAGTNQFRNHTVLLHYADDGAGGVNRNSGLALITLNDDNPIKFITGDSALNLTSDNASFQGDIITQGDYFGQDLFRLNDSTDNDFISIGMENLNVLGTSPVIKGTSANGTIKAVVMNNGLYIRADGDIGAGLGDGTALVFTNNETGDALSLVNDHDAKNSTWSGFNSMRFNMDLWLQNIDSQSINANGNIITSGNLQTQNDQFCNSTDCYTLGQLLEKGIESEVDPFWTNNFTLYNSSWSSINNATYNKGYKYATNGTYIPYTDESNLDVNSSNYWDSLDSTNETQFSNVGGKLTLITSWLVSYLDSWLTSKTTDDLTEGSTNLYQNSTQVFDSITLNGTTIDNWSDIQGATYLGGNNVEINASNYVNLNDNIRVDSVATDNITSQDAVSSIIYDSGVNAWGVE